MLGQMAAWPIVAAVGAGLWFQDSKLAMPFLMSMCSFWACHQMIPRVRQLFLESGLKGRDLNKPDQPEVPESMGMIVGVCYLVCLFIFTPYFFLDYFVGWKDPHSFPYDTFVKFLAALLSICCMTFLGFADDVLNLKWRYKLVLPTIASLPLLMVYFISSGSTTISVPRQLREILGDDLNIGGLYYVYMGMLAVFCTNAINILAGVNGLEAGQSFVIGVSIMANNFIQFHGPNHKEHMLSLLLLGPFVATTAALLCHNWYPSSVFVGDTYCYLAGMTFAVVGILGHFSKTVLLFFIPQVLNFLYSTPQLFRLIPCPRHRMPKLDIKTNKLDNSFSVFKMSELTPIGQRILAVITTFRLARIIKKELPKGDIEVSLSNLTLINYVLYVNGPLREDHLCMALLALQ
eukprot:Ihof_evm4s281 gene=Ihof_evmTU4s281